MPKALEDLVAKLKRQGKDESSAYAIATAALQKRGILKKKRKTKTKRIGDMK